MIDVVAAILIKDKKILCARRKIGLHLEGLWEFPGGKVEPGESFPVSLKRELKEELSIKIRVGKFVSKSIYDYGTKIIRLNTYWCEWLSGDLVLNDHDKICWMSIEQLGSLDWAPADIPIIDFLVDGDFLL